MPIRMTDDPNQGRNDNGPRVPRGGGGGGGGGIGSLIPMLLGLVFRYPKVAIPLAIIGGVFFYFKGGSFSGGESGGSGAFSLGATLDEEEYDKALVYEPMAAAGTGDNKALPEKVSLLQYAPSRRSQGSQGSCVGWASSYAARTILYARQSGKKPDEIVFSPSFLYNQISMENCDGSYLVRAMEVLRNRGDLPLSQFPYDENSCSKQPSQAQMDAASAFRITGSTRLSLDASDYRVNSVAIKQHLAQGSPIVIGMMVGGSFEQAMVGKKVWIPRQSDYDNVESFGGHAMCVIGYDDVLEGGCFQIMNSWGTDWGDQGVAFVRYKDFDFFVREAHAIYPMGDAKRAASQEISFGLQEYGTQKRIAVKNVGGFSYRTTSPIRVGTRFKVEVANTVPCYTYIFGQETDGSSYVLFPYTAKHSPYCGTVGTRVFPKDQSLTADDKGTRDYIAVVISQQELDYSKLNGQISKAPGKTYGDKLRAALGAKLSDKLSYGGDGSLIRLKSAESSPDKVHAMIIEFDKK